MKESIRKFRAVFAVVAALALAVCCLAGCSGGSQGGSESASAASASTASQSIDELVFAWEPGASEGKYENMRDLIAQAIQDGSGIPTETMTTTDYNVCIEAVNSGQADYASLGAKEYVELHKKNPEVEVAWVLSNDEGELDQVSYHSQILVPADQAEQYKQADGTYALTKEDMEGKNMSWVELSSTSGYVIPSIILAKDFSIADSEELGESGKFFETVLFGGSHVNSIYNMLTGDADFCACDDTGAANNYNVIEGKNGENGALYEIKEGLEAPLDEYAGQQLRVVASYPVPAVPFVVNTEFVPEDVNEAVIDYMTSDAVSQNPQLFKDPGDSDTVTKWTQSTGKVRFIRADDSYYDAFRELIGE